MKDFKDIEMAERFEDWQFLKLAKKYARHYHYDMPLDPDCMVCEAIQVLDAGQNEVADMLQGKGLPF